jgi:hypothetical protein
MKFWKKIFSFLLLVACVVGSLLLDGTISNEKVEHSPPWLRDIYTLCVIIFGVCSIWIWIYDYNKRRYRDGGDDTNTKS